MGSVDKSDMILSTVTSLRKTLKWYRKLFFRFTDMTLYNSHKLYQQKEKKKIPIAEFQLALIKEMIEKFSE